MDYEYFYIDIPIDAEGEDIYRELDEAGSTEWECYAAVQISNQTGVFIRHYMKRQRRRRD